MKIRKKTILDAYRVRDFVRFLMPPLPPETVPADWEPPPAWITEALVTSSIALRSFPHNGTFGAWLVRCGIVLGPEDWIIRDSVGRLTHCPGSSFESLYEVVPS